MVIVISSEDKKIRKLVEGLYFKTKQEAINYLETFKIKACDISNCSFITLEREDVPNEQREVSRQESED